MSGNDRRWCWSRRDPSRKVDTRIDIDKGSFDTSEERVAKVFAEQIVRFSKGVR